MKMITKNTGTNLLKYALFALAISTLCGTAHASWWKDEWPMRKKITVDTTDTGIAITDPIGTVPVLIRLHDGNFQFAGAKDDGSDLRFVSEDNKTLLSYHIEKYDPLLSEAFVWVKIPDLKPNAKTSFWLYYGNSGNSATKVDDAKGTYDSDTALVYHFGQRGAPAMDSSGSGNNAQNAGTSVDGSLIGPGLRFDGKNAVTIPASSFLTWANGANVTWSAWIKPAASQTRSVIFSRRDGAKAFIIGIENGVPFVEMTDTNGTRRSPAGEAIPANAWRHLAVVASGSTITLYLNGESYATLNDLLPAFTGPALIGGDSVAGAAGFVGELDELNISNVARPAGFIKLAAIGQGGEKTDRLLVIGQDEEPSSWLSWMSNGYVGIIIKSLTLDGWIVIGILIIMSAISWFVMIGKASYLNGVRKGNAEFLKEWRHLATDLTVLDHGDEDKVTTLGGRVGSNGHRAMRKSPLYVIYKIGAEEIRHRMATERNGGPKVLSARSIQAIRASLDAGMVRETQKLNNLMVLLTIAISGGPFLGLLGTVVGVMITFAAIAAAGDVNVNAIAPGIAAALVATVAGLAVAIPALFGYNYLVSRVKDATSDIHIFIDEFVTKMAEFYCDSQLPSNGKHSGPITQADIAAQIAAGFARHRPQGFSIENPDPDLPATVDQ